MWRVTNSIMAARRLPERASLTNQRGKGCYADRFGPPNSRKSSPALLWHVAELSCVLRAIYCPYLAIEMVPGAKRTSMLAVDGRGSTWKGCVGSFVQDMSEMCGGGGMVDMCIEHKDRMV